MVAFWQFQSHQSLKRDRQLSSIPFKTAFHVSSPRRTGWKLEQLFSRLAVREGVSMEGSKIEWVFVFHVESDEGFLFVHAVHLVF